MKGDGEMEIRIKTQDEFQQGHVTIEISGAQHEAEIVADRLAIDAGTIEGLRDQVSDLEQELAAARRAREIEAERANDAERKVSLYDVDRQTEQDRANRHAAEVIRKIQQVADLERDLERYRKAHVCTDRCTKDAHVAFEGNTLVKELEEGRAADHREIVALRAARDDALGQVMDREKETFKLREELTSERAKARSYREEMQRRFTTAQVADAKEGARADERARLTREELDPRQKMLTSISQAVYGPDQMQALDRLEESEADYVQVLAKAVRKVREILGPGV